MNKCGNLLKVNVWPAQFRQMREASLVIEKALLPIVKTDLRSMHLDSSLATEDTSRLTFVENHVNILRDPNHRNRLVSYRSGTPAFLKLCHLFLEIPR
jgi:hypothetical protein